MTTLPSTLDAVTVYREGAVCLRRARLSAQSKQVRVGGLPISMEPGSLRARVLSGEARVQDVRAQFDVQVVDELDVPAETKAFEVAQESVARLEQRLARVDSELTELHSLAPKFLEPKRGEPPRAAPVASVMALADFVDGELEARLAERRALHHDLENARRELELRQRRLHESSTSKRSERARVERVAVVTLAQPADAGVELGIEYQVPGVRWVPSYQLKLERGLGSGALTLRAAIAQNTGEDWNHVELALSTSSLARRADVPVLRALKIGRRQAEPTKTGWREPPSGLDELFAGYDAAAIRPSAPPPLPRVKPRAAPAERRAKKARREQSDAVADAVASESTPPTPMLQAPMASRAMPVAAPAVSRSLGFVGAIAGMASNLARRERSLSAKEAGEEDFDAAPEAIGEPSIDEAAPWGAGPETKGYLDVAMQDYARLVMVGPKSPGRGHLEPMGEWDSMFPVGVSVQIDVLVSAVAAARRAALSVREIDLPGSTNPVSSLDAFDYRYDCGSRVSVPSTGKWVSVAVTSCQVGLTPEYVCVPGLDSRVYRTLQVSNRSPAALLPGPVDVTVGDEFLMTTRLPAVPPRADATHRLGLGVEEAIKVARKTSFKENTGGFLSGATLLPHEIEIELSNRLATAAKVEVRERVPSVAPEAEKDVKVEETLVQPPWETIEAPLDGQAVVRGARRWVVTVPPGERLTLVAQYAIRMPSDRMLVGGNRRI